MFLPATEEVVQIVNLKLNPTSRLMINDKREFQRKQQNLFIGTFGDLGRSSASVACLSATSSSENAKFMFPSGARAPTPHARAPIPKPASPKFLLWWRSSANEGCLSANYTPGDLQNSAFTLLQRII